MIEPRTAKATQARVKKGKEFSEGILKILKEHPTGVTLYRLSKLHQSSPGATLGAIERISNKIISKESESEGRKVKLYFLKRKIEERKNPPGYIKLDLEKLDKKQWKHNASIYGIGPDRIEVSAIEKPSLKKFLHRTILLKSDDQFIEFVLPHEFIDFYELDKKNIIINYEKDKIIIKVTKEQQPLPSLSKKKVLIVDDENNQIIKNIKDHFRKKHKVGEVDNLKDAKIRIRNEKPDFMILDWTLKDSPRELKELLDYMKSKSKNSHAIIITAHPFEREDVTKEIKYGFVWFFSKFMPKLPEAIEAEMVEVLS